MHCTRTHTHTVRHADTAQSVCTTFCDVCLSVHVCFDFDHCNFWMVFLWGNYLSACRNVILRRAYPMCIRNLIEFNWKYQYFLIGESNEFFMNVNWARLTSPINWCRSICLLRTVPTAHTRNLVATFIYRWRTNNSTLHDADDNDDAVADDDMM